MQPRTHQEALNRLHQKYEHGIQNGDFVPFTYPMTTYGALVLLLFFLIPPYSRFHTPLSRQVTFVTATAFHSFLIIKTRGYAMPVGFGIGIVSTWGIIWSAVVLIFHDSKRDFNRVKKVSEDSHNELASEKKSGIETIKTFSQKQYVWQAYPIQPLSERLYWVLDLLSNFRGVGWDWKASVLPSLPPFVQKHLRQSSGKPTEIKDVPVSRNGIVRFDNSQLLTRHNIWLFIKGYLAIDLGKVLINHDPYFWGYIDCPPPQYLPAFFRASTFLVKGYRLSVSMSMVWLVLRTIFCLGPLLFVGVIGPTYLGSNGEPWMYVDHYGSYSNVFERGLAGWWGGWWHQTFRFAFDSAGIWLARKLGIEQASMKAKIVKLLVAFSLSGFLHGCGSVTMLGDTNPWTGMFLFFLLQPVGIIFETMCRTFLRNKGLSKRCPRIILRIWNFTYTHMWFYVTAPLIANDFARGGLWLLEPLMFSPLRGLGFGAEGDGFFCWGGRLLTWHWDPNNWWRSGIAM